MDTDEQSIIDSLNLLSGVSHQQPKIKLKKIFSILAGRGYASLLVIFSLPFCIPIQIPGFSTPFGIILAFIGLRIAFAKKIWWPKWILEKELQSKYVMLFAEKAIRIINKLQKILHPRLLNVIKNQFSYRLHGLLIFFLSILLALPLPIPFSNMLAATPIFLIGIGLLEDDGLAILIGDFIAMICFLSFFGLYLLGTYISSSI